MKNVKIKEVLENPSNYKLCYECGSINYIDNIQCINDCCRGTAFNDDEDDVKEIAKNVIEYNEACGKTKEEAENAELTVAESEYSSSTIAKRNATKFYKVAYNPNISQKSREEISSRVNPSMFNDTDLEGQYELEAAIEKVTSDEDKEYLQSLKDIGVDYVEF